MIGKILFSFFLTTAFGRIILRDKPIHPTERTSGSRREVPNDVYDFLYTSPYLRSADDFIKLPRELFQKWFGKIHQSEKAMNDELPLATEVSIDPLGPPNNPLPDTNNTNDVKKNNDNANEFKPNPDVPKEDGIKNVNVDFEEEYSRDVNDYNNENPKQNYNRGVSSELPVKQKIFELIKDTKASIDKKLEPIQAVHDAFKMNRVYKIGYLVSNINRTDDSLKEYYTHIEENIRHWDIMKALNAYGQVKTADEFLSKALHILNLVGATTPYTRFLPGGRPYTTLPGARPYTTPTYEDSDVTDRLAWSYYDENM